MEELRNNFNKRMAETLKKLEDKNIKSFTNKGKMIYPFARVNELNINSFEELYVEMVLIYDKKSNLSKTNRDALINAYKMCFEPLKTIKNGK